MIHNVVFLQDGNWKSTNCQWASFDTEFLFPTLGNGEWKVSYGIAPRSFISWVKIKHFFFSDIPYGQHQEGIDSETSLAGLCSRMKFGWAESELSPNNTKWLWEHPNSFLDSGDIQKLIAKSSKRIWTKTSSVRHLPEKLGRLKAARKKPNKKGS